MQRESVTFLNYVHEKQVSRDFFTAESHPQLLDNYVKNRVDVLQNVLSEEQAVKYENELRSQAQRLLDGGFGIQFQFE